MCPEYKVVTSDPEGEEGALEESGRSGGEDLNWKEAIHVEIPHASVDAQYSSGRNSARCGNTLAAGATP